MQRNVFARAAATALSKGYPAGPIQLRMHFHDLDLWSRSRCISLAICQTAQGGMVQRNVFARAAATALSKRKQQGAFSSGCTCMFLDIEVEITLYQSCDLADSTRWHCAAQRICEGGSDGAVKVRLADAGSPQGALACVASEIDIIVSQSCDSSVSQGGILQRNKFARAAATALSKGYPAGPIQHRHALV